MIENIKKNLFKVKKVNIEGKNIQGAILPCFCNNIYNFDIDE